MNGNAWPKAHKNSNGTKEEIIIPNFPVNDWTQAWTTRRPSFLRETRQWSMIRATKLALDLDIKHVLGSARVRYQNDGLPTSQQCSVRTDPVSHPPNPLLLPYSAYTYALKRHLFIMISFYSTNTAESRCSLNIPLSL